MRWIGLGLSLVVMWACFSSTHMEQDVGNAVVTENKGDVRGCRFVARVVATVELGTSDGDRAEAMDLLLDRLRNNALHKNCDTVFLITVEESTTHLTANGEGYICGVTSITGGGRAGMGGSLP